MTREYADLSAAVLENSNLLPLKYSPNTANKLTYN